MHIKKAQYFFKINNTDKIRYSKQERDLIITKIKVNQNLHNIYVVKLLMHLSTIYCFYNKTFQVQKKNA